MRRVTGTVYHNRPRKTVADVAVQPRGSGVTSVMRRVTIFIDPHRCYNGRLPDGRPVHYDPKRRLWVYIPE